MVIKQVSAENRSQGKNVSIQQIEIISSSKYNWPASKDLGYENVSRKEKASSTEDWGLLWKNPSFLLPIAQLW